MRRGPEIDQLSNEVYSAFREHGAVGVESIAPPPVWNDPVNMDGLIVEVGRREDDVLFHLWFEDFPEDFSDLLEQVIEKAGLLPHRFEASETDELRGLWSGEKLLVGPKKQVLTMARPATFRLLQTWAVKAKDYASSDHANEILCGPFIAGVRKLLE